MMSLFERRFTFFCSGAGARAGGGVIPNLGRVLVLDSLLEWMREMSALLSLAMAVVGMSWKMI
jgi:hypothetical protein